MSAFGVILVRIFPNSDWIRTGVLKNLAIFRGKRLVEIFFWWCCWPEGLQLYEREKATQVFSCEYCEIFKNTYLEEHQLTAASNLCFFRHPEHDSIQVFILPWSWCISKNYFSYWKSKPWYCFGSFSVFIHYLIHNVCFIDCKGYLRKCSKALKIVFPCLHCLYHLYKILLPFLLLFWFIWESKLFIQIH